MERRKVSGIMLSLMLIGMLALAFSIQSVKATGTIYIRVNGSVEGTDRIQRNGDTYTFTDNIYDSGGIVVEKNSIVIDGNGYTLQGESWQGYGIDLSGTTNVTVRNTQITKFWDGIRLDYSPNNSISGNTIADNGFGIWLEYSSGSNVCGNTITANNKYGINIVFSSGINVCGNTITANNVCGINFGYSSGSNVSGNTITANSGDGIGLSRAQDMSFSGNIIAENKYYGIGLGQANYISISRNTITANSLGGIDLDYQSSDSSVSGNTITANNGCGVRASWSLGNVISGNTIAENNEDGILLDVSFDNSISGNNITANNRYGIQILAGPYPTWGNSIYHNNFIDNTDNVHIDGSINVWDDGYVSGGNYWSDYTGVDEQSGSDQDHAGSDGIGDAPYIIDAQNVDHYPLMNPWIPFVTAIADTKPDSLSLRSRLMWITAYIELSAPYSPRGIDVSTVKLNGVVQAELNPTEIGDYDGDGVLDLMVKFKGANVMPLLCKGVNRLAVTGKANGIVFEGVDTIIVRA